MGVGSDNLRHALYGAMPCPDPDCELHYPDVAFAEGAMNETELAWFIAGCRTGISVLPAVPRIMEFAKCVHDESLAPSNP